jgi:hypothetical protein
MACDVPADALIAAACADNANSQRFVRAALNRLAVAGEPLGMFFGNERHEEIDFRAESGKGVRIRVNVGI